MKTKVNFEHRTGGQCSVYMIYIWKDDDWIAIQYARDLSKCEYGANVIIWDSESQDEDIFKQIKPIPIFI